MELIFRDDPYAHSCEATVTAVDDRGIRLDRTVFYPMGGGQPGERVAIRYWNGQRLLQREGQREDKSASDEGGEAPEVCGYEGSQDGEGGPVERSGGRGADDAVGLDGEAAALDVELFGERHEGECLGLGRFVGEFGDNLELDYDRGARKRSRWVKKKSGSSHIMKCFPLSVISS